jgi:hypothetical protein
MKSYCVLRLPENVSVLSCNKLSSRVVYCYDNDHCLHYRVFSSYEEADGFGHAYLDSDWEKYGFPSDDYLVPQKYLDYINGVM